MRILQLLSQTQPTGAESYALALSEWLDQQGHTVFIASDRLHAPTRQTYVPLAVHDKRLKARLKSTRFLRSFLKENKIQVIHCHSRAAARLAYWSTFGTKVAVVSTLHGRQPVSFSKKLHDIFGEKCISICENLTEQLTSTLNMNPRKIRLIRNPLDSQTLPFTENLPAAKIAWIGRFTGPKGTRAQQFIAQVLPGLLKENPELTVDIIGGDPALLGEETLKLVSELCKTYQNRVRIENHRPHLEKDLSNYSLVLAAGRIAIASLLRGIPTIAIGEYSCEGLVRVQTLDKAMASNFGDIGADGRAMSEVDFSELARQVSSSQELSKDDRLQLREQVLRQYDLRIVCQKILNTYKSAYFLKQHPAQVPVLMYHKIPAEELQTKHRIFVTKNNFEKHLQFFQQNGYTTLTFSDLEAYRSGEKDFSEFPRKPVVLTFDDGYIDNLENAGPLLKKYNMKAVIYLLADHSLENNAWDLEDTTEPAHALMSLEQKQQLKDSNFEIGSHGFRHQKITLMSEEEARREFEESKARLQQDLRVPVVSFAYTYGVMNPKNAELAEEAGYSFALNTDSGGLHLEENPFAVFRANIFPEDGPAQLRKKTAPWYRRYFYLKRGR